MFTTKVQNIEKKESIEEDEDQTTDIKTYWRNFITEATVHGMNKLSGSKIRIAVWTTIILGCTSYLVFLLSTRLVYYFSYPTRSETSIEFHNEMVFPAVTICNLSWRNRSRIDNSSQADIFYGSICPIRSILPSVNWSDPFYNESGYFEPGDISNFTTAAMTLEKFVLMCWFDSSDCSSPIEPVLTYPGQCYTFNGEGNLKTRFHGSDYNLQMIIDVNRDLYTWGNDVAAGIQVLIHDPHTFPDVQGQGFRIKPGSSAYAEITKQTFSYLPKPYQAFKGGYCQESLTTWTYNNKTYIHTTDTCFRNCYARIVYAECGCRHYTDIIDGKICSRYQYQTCYLPKKDEAMSDIAIKLSCNCQRQCSFNAYTTSISTAIFPSDFMGEVFENVNFSKADYLKRNVIFLKAYLKDLSTQSFRQSALYPSIDEVFAQIGGQMGLLLGASVVSLIELTECLIGMLKIGYRRLQREKKTET